MNIVRTQTPSTRKPVHGNNGKANRIFLVAPKPLAKSSRSLLSLWHLCSLDAPSVAATWVWFIARCCNVQLPWTSPTAMFVATWMVYAADRLLDAQSAIDLSAPHLEARHRFHATHSRAFLATIVLSASAMVTLLHTLLTAELKLFAALGSLLFAYFFLIHLWPHTQRTTKTEPHRLPKELAVGVFFAAAVFIPTVARVPSLRLSLMPITLLFAATCTLNCLYVYAWEHPGEQLQAHWTTRFAVHYLSWLASIAFALAMLTVVLHAVHATWVLLPAVACAISVAGFLVLHAWRTRLDPTDLRGAVDFALLSPLALLPLAHLFSR